MQNKYGHKCYRNLTKKVCLKHRLRKAFDPQARIFRIGLGKSKLG